MYLRLFAEVIFLDRHTWSYLWKKYPVQTDLECRDNDAKNAICFQVKTIPWHWGPQCRTWAVWSSFTAAILYQGLATHFANSTLIVRISIDSQTAKNLVTHSVTLNLCHVWWQPILLRFVLGCPGGFLIGWGMNALGRPWPSPRTGLGRVVRDCACARSFRRVMWLRNRACWMPSCKRLVKKNGWKSALGEPFWPFGYPLVLWSFSFVLLVLIHSACSCLWDLWVCVPVNGFRSV